MAIDGARAMEGLSTSELAGQREGIPAAKARKRGSKPGRRKVCRLCGGIGHNKATCRMQGKTPEPHSRGAADRLSRPVRNRNEGTTAPDVDARSKSCSAPTLPKSSACATNPAKRVGPSDSVICSRRGAKAKKKECLELRTCCLPLLDVSPETACCCCCIRYIEADDENKDWWMCRRCKDEGIFCRLCSDEGCLDDDTGLCEKCGLYPSSSSSEN